jgi:DNA repair exonuclease SbcCD ATPase subunit
MEELKKKYAQQSALYESYIREGASPDKISALNVEIAKTLEEMIGLLAQAKGMGIEQYRTQLVENLHRIQRDYTGLKQNTDKIETLRRIRSEEYNTAPLQRYLIFFFAILFVILILLLFFQRKPTAAAIPSSPAIATTFT